jgi:hypothetical protein
MEREAWQVEFSLLDLVQAVQDEANDDGEVVATLVHLLAERCEPADG